MTAIRVTTPAPARQVIYTSTGWRCIEGEWWFLHAAGAVGAKGHRTDVKATLRGNLQHYALPAPPTGETLSAAVRASLRLLNVAERSVSVPVLAAIYRAPLGETEFSLHLNGLTGTMKTTLAVLALQHFGPRFSHLKLEAWKSTANAITEVLYLSKDVVTVVDDFAPQGSSKAVRAFHDKAEQVFRGAANSAAPGRLGPDMRLREEHPPRSMVLSTGEEVPSGESLNARIVDIQFSPTSIRRDKLNECQREGAAGLPAQALAGFLQWVASRYAAVQEQVRRRTRELQWQRQKHARSQFELERQSAARRRRS